MTASANPVDVLVLSDHADLLAELIAGAHSLAEHTGGQVSAIVVGPRSEAEDALRQGADRVLWQESLPAGRIADDIVPSVAAVVSAINPFAVLIGATTVGRAAAGRLAATLGVSALTDVLEFVWQGQNLQARHMIFGGGAVRVDRPLAFPLIATIGSGVFSAASFGTASGDAIEPLIWVEPRWQAALLETHNRGKSSVNLSAAKRVVCPGRGLAQQDDLSMIEELTRLLSAELACTRPLAEGLGWLPRERYIGISGATVKPDLYLGIGVSGQAQHTIGMSDSRIVVTINKDRGAPLVAQSDYAVIGDLYQVVPALIQALNSRRGK